MKILILGFTKVKYMPYLNFYYENLDKVRNDVHILYWNRDLKEENLTGYESATFHEFACFQEDEVGKLSKIKSFLRYRKYARKLIKEEKFDFIIVLHSLPGVLIYKLLRKKYKDKYMFDYRDSTYESFSFFKKIIEKLVKNSKCTFVSSDGFRKYLPESQKEKTFTSHNLLMDSLLHRKDKEQFGTKSDKIRIAFWGFIRHEGVNKTIINRICSDERFELHYYGREQETALKLKEYVGNFGAKNVFFHGEYKPADRYEFIKNTDLIHNLYFDNNTMLAMGNKFYDGIIFYLHQLCMTGSFMGQECTKNGVGLECDPNDEAFCQTVYDYYKGLDSKEFKKNCDLLLDKILKEYEQGKEVINDI